MHEFAEKEMFLTFDDFRNSQFSLRRSRQQQGYVGRPQNIHSIGCDKSNINGSCQSTFERSKVTVNMRCTTLVTPVPKRMRTCVSIARLILGINNLHPHFELTYIVHMDT